MIPARVVAVLGGIALLIAWLASAASAPAPAPRQESPPAATSGTETLAADVQRQAERLRARLLEAPAPRAPIRNPFAFAPVEPRAVRPRREVAAAVDPLPPPAPAPSRPPLVLIGIAETATPGGLRRTAIIEGPDQLYLVGEGESVTTLFQVKSIGADAVELSDVTGGPPVRLVLRP
jgi:hypothetical protein